jgi:hypothetical protein
MIRRLGKKGRVVPVATLVAALRRDVRAAGGLKAFARKHRRAPETIGRLIGRRSKTMQPGPRVAALYGCRIRKVVSLEVIR